MRFERLRLFNFRQFEAVAGEPQLVEFARPGPRNVTAVFGTNGAGKSTILNAFTWCLFGRTTKALKNPGLVVNQNAMVRATEGTRVPCWVEIEFTAKIDDEDVLHTIRRSISYSPAEQRTVDQEAPPHGECTLQYARRGLGTTVVEDPAEVVAYVNRLLPAELLQYFFIDGERIANLAKPENSEEVQRAVEVFVGLRELTKGADQLDEAAESFDKEAGRHEKENRKFAELTEATEAAKDRQRSLELDLTKVEENLRSTELRAAELSEILKQHDSLRVLEERRTKLKTQRAQRRSEIGQASVELGRMSVVEGWTAFAGRASLEFLRTDLDLRRRGELPYPIRKPFIDELLQRRQCLCKRTLDETCDEGRVAADALRAELEKPDFSEIQQLLYGATTVASAFEPRRQRLASEMDSRDKAGADARSILEAVESELLEVEEKLKGSGETGMAEVAERRARLEGDVRTLRNRRSNLLGDIEKAREQVEELEARRAKVAPHTAAGDLAVRRRDACRRVAKAMRDIYQIEREAVRMRLEERMESLFRDYSITDYRPIVTQAYELRLQKRLLEGAVDAVPDSTGEGQALALAFIGAVAGEAAARREGDTFPLVIDSQFGSLDANHHARIGAVLPRQVGQLVLVQSKTQWTPEMRTAVRAAVGRDVVLVRHTLRSDVGEEPVTGNGAVREMVDGFAQQKYPYVETAESDSTTVVSAAL